MTIFLHILSHQKNNLTHVRINTPTPVVGIPQTFSIPSFHIFAQVESVGMDTQGRMDIPKNAQDVGWYNLGFRPGQNGSAVLDGHYDTPTGAPAVFYTISQLKPGNTLLITDTLGKTYTFVVTQNTQYPYDQLPLQQIFASKGKKELNLITCSGIWDKNTHNYSTRDVVYAQEK